MKIVRSVAGCIKTFLPFLFITVAATAATDKPNIIIIYADDMGWSDVGYKGYIGADFYETAHIDRLASEGMIFDRFYPGAANCAPSRAIMLTGTYSPRTGVYLPQGLSRGGDIQHMRWKVPAHDGDESFNTFHVSINNVEPHFESLAEMLKRAGYVSARLGKWHIGDDNQGFDVSSAEGTFNFVTNVHGQERRYYSDITVAERLTDAALKFIHENKDGPFFLYLAHWEPHTPRAAREERIQYYRDKLAEYRRRGRPEVYADKDEHLDRYDPVYAAMIEQLDISTGRVLAMLEALELVDNTIVIFTSDNGGLERLTSNYPLRSGKGTFYEGGIRTPFAIRWPGVIEPGSRTDYPVNGVDMMPTFAELVGVPTPRSQPVDGISFIPLIKGKPMPEDRTLFFHFPIYLGGDVRPLPAYNGTPNFWRAVPSTTMMKGDWKLIYYYEYESYELFNLRDDLSEKHNLAEARRDVADRMLAELHAWVRNVDAPVPTVPNIQ